MEDDSAAARLARLGQSCAAGFSSAGVPDAARVDAVAAALNCVSAADVGLAAEAAAVDAPQPSQGGVLWRAATRLAELAGVSSRPAPRGPAAVRYLALHEGTTVTVGIFVLPQGAGIPLHDHPGMTVLSRVLYGELEVRSFDWTAGGSAATGGAAQLAWSGVLCGPAPARVLRPTDANLHVFHARTACAVLDVLSPPYSVREGRGCSYFAEEAQLEQGGSAWLTPVPPAPSFSVVRAAYTGPPLLLS